MPYLNFTALDTEGKVIRDIYVIDQHNQTSWSFLPPWEEEEQKDEWYLVEIYESSETDDFELQVELTNSNENTMHQPFYNEHITAMNSTNLVQKIQMGDYLSTESFEFKQIIRHNETDSAHAVFQYGEWSDDFSLELQHGFRKQSYELETGPLAIKFTVSALEPGVFHQFI